MVTASLYKNCCSVITKGLFILFLSVKTIRNGEVFIAVNR